MGRIYSRTALPNELVDRFGNGWRDAFDSLLKTPLNDNETVSDHIPNMFIAWAPDEETEGPYTVDFVLVATDGSKAEQIDRILEGLRPADTDLLNAKFRVEAADALMLADVEGLTNFSDWDYLSPLAEEGARTL